MRIADRFKNRDMITLQLIGWGVILAISVIWGFVSNSESYDTYSAVKFTINILTLVVIYILNYSIFIPNHLFANNRRRFFVDNIVVVAILMAAMYILNKYDLLHALRPPEDIIPRRKPIFMILTRDFINYVLMIGLVTALRLSKRLEQSEAALREAENARVKAELDNLRSQINPHFLLNTLNNIYALTTIDTAKAQKSIKELSDLLRYILYDNLNDRVSLLGEAQFLKTYIELMSIRLPRKVVVTTDFKIADDCTTQIAPLIFISLIENAFKHSVSASGEGFITIHFADIPQRHEVELLIANSNNAKADHDQSGHGIGLEQVRRRLELLYPDAHTWEITDDRQVYTSKLTIKTQEQ